MGRIQDKRDREREAIYNQYVVYSKTASKLLLALVSVALYIGYTIYENSNAVEGIEQQVKDEVSSTYGPFNSALYESQVSHALDTLKYELPVVRKPIDNREFFILCPMIFFILTCFYWLYLSNSLKQFRLLSTYLGQGGQWAFLYPWLYWLPMRCKWRRFLWQLLLELFPVAFLTFLLITFLASFEYYALQALLCVVLLAIPLIVHMYLFEVKFGYKGHEYKQGIVLGLLIGIFLTVHHLSTAGTIPGLSFYLPSVGNYMTYFIAISVIERLVFGNPLITATLLTPIIAFIYAPLWLANRRKWRSPVSMLRAGLSPEPVSGYVAYFKHRYRELKRIQ